MRHQGEVRASLPLRRTEGAPGPAVRSCPFCGGAATWEAHFALPDAVRVGCGHDACGVRPATEYLLREFADELAARWNARPFASNLSHHTTHPEPVCIPTEVSRG